MLGKRSADTRGRNRVLRAGEAVSEDRRSDRRCDKWTVQTPDQRVSVIVLKTERLCFLLHALHLRTPFLGLEISPPLGGVRGVRSERLRYRASTLILIAHRVLAPPAPLPQWLTSFQVRPSPTPTAVASAPRMT